eukprot:CAMPEP_0184547484 /NCGR_PEP_ID=MMETSP0199_2-20130426/5604_1 /TAXON_ID=1112570 /ORGANISM="Thraustochytrium sp., Strain LLF1b" /LENGTH=88 /DNA_ID=CAMNT_0026941991 /DNA_START=589 /DNA_END=856 /DNA_ORIENTATION=+
MYRGFALSAPAKALATGDVPVVPTGTARTRGDLKSDPEAPIDPVVVLEATDDPANGGEICASPLTPNPNCPDDASDEAVYELTFEVEG